MYPASDKSQPWTGTTSNSTATNDKNVKPSANNQPQVNDGRATTSHHNDDGSEHTAGDLNTMTTPTDQGDQPSRVQGTFTTHDAILTRLASLTDAQARDTETILANLTHLEQTIDRMRRRIVRVSAYDANGNQVSYATSAAPPPPAAQQLPHSTTTLARRTGRTNSPSPMPPSADDTDDPPPTNTTTTDPSASANNESGPPTSMSNRTYEVMTATMKTVLTTKVPSTWTDADQEIIRLEATVRAHETTIRAQSSIHAHDVRQLHIAAQQILALRHQLQVCDGRLARVGGERDALAAEVERGGVGTVERVLDAAAARGRDVEETGRETSGSSVRAEETDGDGDGGGSERFVPLRERIEERLTAMARVSQRNPARVVIAWSDGRPDTPAGGRTTATASGHHPLTPVREGAEE